MHTGERQVAKMRMAYLRAMLNQDISLFDTEASTGEVIAAITSDIIIVQDALSEKVWINSFVIIIIIILNSTILDTIWLEKLILTCLPPPHLNFPF
jgi:ABC-type multidrug transport system fused ATPase/permease subunit